MLIRDASQEEVLVSVWLWREFTTLLTHELVVSNIVASVRQTVRRAGSWLLAS